MSLRSGMADYVDRGGGRQRDGPTSAPEKCRSKIDLRDRCTVPCFPRGPMILCRKSRRALFKSRDCARRFSIMARIALRTALLASTFAAFLAPSPLLAQHQHGVHAPPAGAQIGEVNFPTSCSPDSQHRFNQAVWTLHSFWYEESLKQFTAIAEAEPSCAMAYWGMAMSQWYPLWFPPSPAMLKSGAAAVAKGLAVPPAIERERAYLEAIGRF